MRWSAYWLTFNSVVRGHLKVGNNCCKGTVKVVRKYGSNGIFNRQANDKFVLRKYSSLS